MAEAILGAGGALIVLAFVFASFIAIVPLLTAAVAILSTLLIIRGLAVVAAMTTAGRAVMFSGLTVTVGLLALMVMPVSFLRSVGVAGILIPLISVAVALTLLPVILVTVGPRLDWPRIRHEDHAGRGWLAWGRLVTRHRVPATVLGIGVLAALIVAATGIRFGNPTAASPQGDLAERRVGRRGVGRDDAGVAARQRLRALFGIPATGTITQWVPLMMFRVPVRPLDGLRGVHPRPHARGVRRHWITTEAAVRGIARTGRLVTSAALILFLSFVAMGTGPETEIKILATGLGGLGSCSTRRSSGRCLSRRWCRCSGAGTGGCPSDRRGSCGSVRHRSRLRNPRSPPHADTKQPETRQP